MDTPASSQQTATHLGTLGEQLVAQWLRSHGWIILHHQWKCKAGELDLIARSTSDDPILAFVEVKTRSANNWDSDGLLAITPSKQTKLLKAAQNFLWKHPEYTELPCRFDVAIVHRSPRSQPIPPQYFSQTRSGYALILTHYLADAFGDS